MKMEEVLGTWNDLQTKLKQKYPVLTDDDLNFEKGHEQKMLSMVEYKLGMTKQELLDIIESL